MDLETAKKLNEALRQFGYTVGRIEQEIGAYEDAIKFCNMDGEFEKAKEIESELNEIRYTGNRDIPKWKYFDHHTILDKHGIKS